MANVATSLSYMVLAAVVVTYAQRRSQLVARTQYERAGADVTMRCGALGPEASVSWKVNGSDVGARHRLEGPLLVLPRVDSAHNGLYSCFQDPHGERRDTINLRIGAPPTEPSVTCRSNTYPKGFYCSWQLLQPTAIPTDFQVDVQYNQRSLDVQRDPVHKNRVHVLFPEVFSSFRYWVNVTVLNALGQASTTLSFEESSIVKPDPPERVVATPLPGSVRRLEVGWSSPSTWPDVDIFPLKYFLRYRPLIREQWQHVELSDSTSHNITDAYAGKEYIIQVAAKDTEIGTWSDWSVAVHATPWIEEPKQISSTTETEPILCVTGSSPVPVSANSPQLGGSPVGGASGHAPDWTPVLLGSLLLWCM